jgi:hypothetical protein
LLGDCEVLTDTSSCLGKSCLSILCRPGDDVDDEEDVVHDNDGVDDGLATLSYPSQRPPHRIHTYTHTHT